MKILAIDIGGTFLKYALMNPDCEMLEQGKVKTPRSGREALIEAIGEIYDAYSRPEGITVSMPGIIDSARGYVFMGGALTYNNEFHFGEALLRRCPARIVINNDAKCAACAEASRGALKDVKDGAVLLFGTMIGGGIVLDHRVRKGIHFSSGEVSYILSDRAADPSYDTVWGNRSGTPALCRLFADRKHLPPEEVDGEKVFDAVNRGDADALEALNLFTKEIAVQIFNLQTILDLERFAIGGGISAQPAFLDCIRRHLDAMYAHSPYYVPRAEVVTCRFGNDANLIGAVSEYLASAD